MHCAAATGCFRIYLQRAGRNAIRGQRGRNRLRTRQAKRQGRGLRLRIVCLRLSETDHRQ